MLIKLPKTFVLAVAALLAVGLWGCAGGGASPSTQTGNSATSSSEVAEETQAAESETIYPWVVVRQARSDGRVYAYDYDEAGRLVSITGQQEELVGYNERGVLSVALSYDADGNLAGIEPGTYLTGEVSIDYGPDGRVSRVAREWTEAGRMPNAGANAYVTDYAYGADGELASSQSTYTVEGTVTESAGREYSAAADKGYDGKATSDGAPPLVEWKDGQVMAGNGVGAGSVGELDAHGNLASATEGLDGKVTFEYAQIAVKRGEWRPSALSNPTLRTFAWDGLSNVNYTWFFPPQLTAADEARVLEADTIEQEPAESEAEAVPATEPAGARLKTPYYTIDLPESYADVEFVYDDQLVDAGGSLLTGYTAKALRGGGELFEVTCFSDNWGPQGQYGSAKLGIPTTTGLTAYVLVPWDGPSDQQAAKARAEEFAGYVTLL